MHPVYLFLLNVLTVGIVAVPSSLLALAYSLQGKFCAKAPLCPVVIQVGLCSSFLGAMLLSAHVLGYGVVIPIACLASAHFSRRVGDRFVRRMEGNDAERGANA